MFTNRITKVVYDNDQFAVWMRAVDKTLEQLVGVASADLPDCCYMDWFEDKVSPLRAAKRVIKAMNAE